MKCLSTSTDFGEGLGRDPLDRFPPHTHIHTRHPTAVAENEDGGPINGFGEEWAVKKYCGQAGAKRRQHLRASQLAPM